jgi:hypothetical protein
METRRFPPPWTLDEHDECFIVRDANGQALAYVYFEEEPGRRTAAKLLTKDEARRMAVNSPSCRKAAPNGRQPCSGVHRCGECTLEALQGSKPPDRRQMHPRPRDGPR